VPSYYSGHEAVQILLCQCTSEHNTTKWNESDKVNQPALQENHPTTSKESEVSKVKTLKTKKAQHPVKMQNHQKIFNEKVNANVANTPHTDPSGLRNLGNTCFVNSALQVLFAIPELDELFDVAHPMANALKELKSHVMNNSRQTTDPSALFTLEAMNEWSVNRQEDVQEYLSWLFDKLHEADMANDPIGYAGTRNDPNSWLNHQLRNNSFVTRNIAGQEKLRYDCPINQCPPFVEYDYFKCRRVFLNTSEIEIEPSVEHGRSCRECGATPMICKSEITRGPLVLFVQLMRFQDDATKISKRMTIPAQIITEHRYHYNLTGIINHHGNSIHAGHYTALIKQDSGSWLKCDDSKVQKYSLPKSSSIAYVLVYKKDILAN
jgi:ubiquitin C-terminal hydrolase